MIEMIKRLKIYNMKGYFTCLYIESILRVDGKVQCEVLRQMGIDVKVVDIMKSMCDDTKAIYKLGEL